MKLTQIHVRKNIPVNKEFALFQMAIDIVDLHIKSYYVLRVIPILIHYPDRGNMVILHAVRCATVYQVKIFPRLPQIAGSAGSAAQNRPIFSPVFFGVKRQDLDMRNVKMGIFWNQNAENFSTIWE